MVSSLLALLSLLVTHALHSRGSWKGYHGTVKKVDEKNALVELQGKQKMVTVPKDALFEFSSGGGGGGGAGAAGASA